MLTFPILRTASAVQYPLQVSGSFATEVLQFLAGDEQRYLVSSGALLTWKIQLELLDEAELTAIEAFFVATNGSFESFSFSDPISGIEYPKCFIASDELSEIFTGELRTSAGLTIRQGRSQ